MQPNKTLWYSCIDGLNLNSIKQDIIDIKPERVVLLNETEWQVQGLDKNFVDLCKNNNVVLNIVYGTYCSDYHIQLFKNIGLDINNVTFWGTQFFNLIGWIFSNVYQGYENYPTPTHYNYPFLNMNCRSHVHRCALIDELAGRNLIEKGRVSWHDHLEENQDFVFKHFNRKNKLRLGDDFETKLDSQLIPSCYFNTFMVLVTEATLNSHFFTEKTVMPLLFKRPFLVIAGKNHNSEFFKLGFEPYNEIFDYSYDSIDDLSLRVSKAVDNVENIIGCDYTSLYDKIKEKIEHNFNLAQKISKDIDFIPDIIKERLMLTNSGYYTHSHIDSRYKAFIKLCS
jgi:hypothetical protein